ncbi:hypothetical protein [Halorubellus litoreus]|uniref:Zinc-ribbon domain-containing protein n=1 Tax=Halorubellus litoreus TaxID=755308 RepID=A0ABD5VGP3_9EURY
MSDPRCPECGEPVGLTSTYCMHCDAEFDSPANVGDDSAADDGLGSDDPGDAREDPSVPDGSVTPDSVADYGTTGEPDDDYGSTGRADGADATASGTADASTGTGSAAGDADESTLVGLLFRVAAVALTVVVGLVATFVLVVAFGETPALWLPVGLVGLFGVLVGIVVVVRQDSGIDALADALYVTAVSLVVVPIAFFLLVGQGEPLLTRLVVSLVFGFGGGVFAVPVFLVGWWLQPD